LIYVLENPGPRSARAWFAYDAEDLTQKMLVSQSLEAGKFSIYWSDTEALAAFEGADPQLVGPAGWWARRALYGQLVALEVLADDC
jgi:hypothetical protein